MSAEDLAKAYAEKRIIRNTWSATDAQGRQLLCLYTALANDPEARPATCPATLAPVWFARLMPNFDDCGTQKAWPGMVKRVVRLAPHLPKLSEECQWRVCAICIREAISHVTQDDWGVLEACKRVTELCDRRGRKEEVSAADIAAAEAAAWAAAGAAAEAAAWAARAAAGAAGAAGAARAARAARAATWDRITDLILTEVERELLPPLLP